MPRAYRLSMVTTTRPMWTCLGRVLAAAVVVVTAACGSRTAGAGVPAASDPATTRSAAPTGVIFGIVQAGPTCPVESARHACRPRPLGDAELRARSARTGLTFSARTSAGGHFFVRLGPGEYVLTVATTAVFPRCPPVGVSVRSGMAVRANITCDTGIRLPARATGKSG